MQSAQAPVPAGGRRRRLRWPRSLCQPASLTPGWRPAAMLAPHLASVRTSDARAPPSTRGHMAVSYAEPDRARNAKAKPMDRSRGTGTPAAAGRGPALRHRISHARRRCASMCACPTWQRGRQLAGGRALSPSGSRRWSGSGSQRLAGPRSLSGGQIRHPRRPFAGPAPCSSGAAPLPTPNLRSLK
jgi:hypothetical protein